MIHSFYVAFKGIIAALRTELNMRIHLLAVVIVTIAGLYFTISKMEWVSVTICFMSVISAEMLNTAIEKLADVVKKEQHPSIGLVKDMAAGAVLITAIGSGVVALLIFLPYLMKG